MALPSRSSGSLEPPAAPASPESCSWWWQLELLSSSSHSHCSGPTDRAPCIFCLLPERCAWLATSFPTPLACPRLFLQERQLESGILFNTLLLPNQTWIHMPTQSKTNLPTSSCHEGKHSIDCRCQARSPGQLVLQTPELPADFRESFFFFFHLFLLVGG